MAAAVRRSLGFTRYALSIQYHGSSFLGFSYQGPKGEDCVLPDGTDLRGYHSVEGRLRQAFSSLVGNDNFENIQVSSRTDRGVHALKNTLHVDIRSQSNDNDKQWDPNSIANGLNYYLIRQHKPSSTSSRKRTRGQAQIHDFLGNPSQRHSPPHEIRVLRAAPAPLTMKNAFYIEEEDQPEFIDWNARFSGTQRTYVYRILHQPHYNQDGIPFEWDRSWLVRNPSLDIEAMKEAALYLTGKYDFTSFRGNNCQRASPVVTMKQIQVHMQPLDSLGMMQMGAMLGLDNASDSNSSSLVTIGIVGDAFLYRQVRNIVGCLMEVGREKLPARDVRGILKERDRRIAPAMAPAHGLFLVDVQHGYFVF